MGKSVNMHECVCEVCARVSVCEKVWKQVHGSAQGCEHISVYERANTWKYRKACLYVWAGMRVCRELG